MENEYDILARKYIGDNYWELTIQQQLVKVCKNIPLDSLERKAILSGIQNLGDIEAREICIDLMRAIRELPETLDNLEKALMEFEKRQP